MNVVRFSLPFRWLCLAFSAGLFLSISLSRLPAVHWLWCALFLPVLLWRAGPVRQCAFVVAMGLLWGLVHAHWQLSHRLPAEWQGEELTVVGTLVGLPDHDPRRERVSMAVASVTTPEGRPVSLPLRRLRVSWYGGPPLHSGERWRLRLRVKQPRGFVNPGGFDYQLWLMRQKVDATGYVREAPENRRLSPPAKRSLSHWREQARDWLSLQPGLQNAALLNALLVGDRTALSSAQWSLLTETGTNHLLAISGLHIGFVAVLGFAVGAGLGRLLNVFRRQWPASVLGHMTALALALGYSALAGFSIPTQRALIMVLIVQWALLARRRVRAGDALALALASVLVLDPLAPFDIGFWLSFTAVAVLLLAFGGRRGRATLPFTGLLWAQWVVFVGLFVPLLVLTKEATLLSPVANALAIPLVTVLVVPWLLGAALAAPVFPGIGAGGLWCADRGLDLLLWWLEALSPLRDGATLSTTFPRVAVALALLGALLCLLPRGFPARWLGVPTLMFAWWLPALPGPSLSIAMLDVGQGLAMVVQTPKHTLVYDTGPTYSERMEAGSAIIAPYLRERGIKQLDAVVVSHGHSDHSGGFAGLAREIPVHRIWAGEPASVKSPGGRVSGVENCHKGDAWQWDRVHFRFLHAGFPEAPNANNHSCVLWIRYRDQNIVLTGDIEREVEWRLIGSDQIPQVLALLQVPHHGADTSSTPTWTMHTRPEMALVSAAYQGYHRHPAPAVVERYRAQGARVLNTAELGALVFEWQRNGQRTEHFSRVHNRRWWYQ